MSVSFAVLKDINSRRIFAGQAISQVCDKILIMALAWFLTAQGSPKLVPWFLAVGALPHLLLARFAGPAVAKWGTLRTVIHTDVLRGKIFLLAAVLWFYRPSGVITPDREIPFLFGLTFLANCASALFNPAVLSTPMLLSADRPETLGPLSALIDACFSLSNVLGPALAAILYPWLGLTGLFFVNALSYFVAAALEAKIRVPEPVKAADTSSDAGEPVMDAIRLRPDRLLRTLLGIFFLMNLALTPLLAFLPLFSRYLFHGEIGSLAALESSLGIGTVLGSLALTVYHPKLKTGARAILGVLTVAASDLAFAVSSNIALACGALLVLGCALSVVNISMMTFFQMRPRPEDVPRVMSWVNLISVGAIPFSMLLVGSVLGHMDLRPLAIALSILLFMLAILTSAQKEFRQA